jgi:hypothetical protein
MDNTFGQVNFFQSNTSSNINQKKYKTNPINDYSKCTNMFYMYVEYCINKPQNQDKCTKNCIYTNTGKISATNMNKCFTESLIHFNMCMKN